MSIFACEKCRERYDLAAEPDVASQPGSVQSCKFCGEPVVVEAEPPPHLLDELLSLAPAKAEPPPAALTDGTSQPEEPKPVLPRLAPSVQQLTAVLVREEGAGNLAPSSTLLPERVSALPPVAAVVPPSTLVQGPSIDVPLAGSQPRGARDSLDDGWGEPASGAPRASAALVGEGDTAEVAGSDDAETIPLEVGADPETVPLEVGRLAASREEPLTAEAVSSADDDDDEWSDVAEDSLAEDSARVLDGTPPVDPARALDAAPPVDRAQPDLSDVLRDATESSPFNGPVPTESSSTSRPWASFGAARASSLHPGLPKPLSGKAPAESPASTSVPPLSKSEGPPSRKKSLLRRSAPIAAGVAAVAAAFFVGLRIGKDSPLRADRTVLSVAPAKTTTAVETPRAAAERPGARAPAELGSPSPPVRADVAPAVSARPGGKPFSTRAANASLASAITRARACRKPGDPAGTAQIAVSFANTGRVSAVDVAGAKIAGTDVASCIATTLKSARVPAFGGAPVTMKKVMKFK